MPRLRSLEKCQNVFVYIFTGPPTHSNELGHLSSSSVALPASGPAGRRARGRSGRLTLHGGPVRLRPVRAATCID